ncbi:hypothetical protein HDV00_006324 [Rhizophlyctis rosea]|nr:hypothetical protein HDV00_006324 [Rhizophlyctis rosea]
MTISMNAKKSLDIKFSFRNGSGKIWLAGDMEVATLKQDFDPEELFGEPAAKDQLHGIWRPNAVSRKYLEGVWDDDEDDPLDNADLILVDGGNALHFNCYLREERFPIRNCASAKLTKRTT